MIKVKDLKAQTGPGNHPILLCTKCGVEYSANANDYQNNSEQLVLTCCRRQLRLVIKRTTYEPVALKP